MNKFIIGLLIGFLLGCVWIYYTNRAERILSEKGSVKSHRIDDTMCLYYSDTTKYYISHTHDSLCTNHKR